MNQIADEFQDVRSLYEKLTANFAKISAVSDSEEDGNIPALVQAILDNRECLGEIQNLSQRLGQLYGEWEAEKPNMDVATDQVLRGLDEQVRDQAGKLETLMATQTEKIQVHRQQVAQELEELRKDSRFRKKFKLASENSPQFIDSTC